MNRYIVYLPNDGDWMEIVVPLMDLGNAQTDKKNLVTLASEEETPVIDAKLKETKKRYVVAKIDGDFGYTVGSDAIAAIDAIKGI